MKYIIYLFLNRLLKSSINQKKGIRILYWKALEKFMKKVKMRGAR